VTGNKRKEGAAGDACGLDSRATSVPETSDRPVEGPLSLETGSMSDFFGNVGPRIVGDVRPNPGCWETGRQMNHPPFHYRALDPYIANTRKSASVTLS